MLILRLSLCCLSRMRLTSKPRQRQPFEPVYFVEAACWRESSKRMMLERVRQALITLPGVTERSAGCMRRSW